MRINCSAGRGIFEVEDCLACALRGENACGYDYALLKAMYAAANGEARRGEIHVTDLTGCIRRAYYGKTRPAPEYPHETLARWLGTATHAFTEGTDEHFASELALAAEGIVGTADLVYTDGRIVDLKTTRWLHVNKLPYGSHEIQVNVYAWMLRKMGREVNRLAIQYIDMSGPSKCRKCSVPVRMFEGELRCPSCFGYVSGAHLGAVLVDVPVWSDADVEQFILEKKAALEQALVFGQTPVAEPSFLCNYCAYREVCALEE